MKRNYIFLLFLFILVVVIYILLPNNFLNKVIVCNKNHCYNYNLQLDQILDNIYISDWISSIDEDLLTKNKIQKIICLNVCKKTLKDKKMYEKLGIKHYDIIIDDTPSENIKRYFEYTNKIIQECVDKNENILVHCTMGVSRSATIIIAYLIKKYGYTYDTAMQVIKKKRNVICPNSGFIKQLIEYRKSLTSS